MRRTVTFDLWVVATYDSCSCSCAATCKVPTSQFPAQLFLSSVMLPVLCDVNENLNFLRHFTQVPQYRLTLSFNCDLLLMLMTQALNVGTVWTAVIDPETSAAGPGPRGRQHPNFGTSVNVVLHGNSLSSSTVFAYRRTDGWMCH